MTMEVAGSAAVGFEVLGGEKEDIVWTVVDGLRIQFQECRLMAQEVRRAGAIGCAISGDIRFSAQHRRP